jgi:hypothetical protein
MDNLGYSDLGAYGGEVSTPVIDALANAGDQFTNFHAYPLRRSEALRVGRRSDASWPVAAQ